MNPQDQALDATLDARDHVFKAMRLAQRNSRVMEALIEIERAATRAVNLQLEMRRTESAQKVAA